MHYNFASMAKPDIKGGPTIPEPKEGSQISRLISFIESTDYEIENASADLIKLRTVIGEAEGRRIQIEEFSSEEWMEALRWFEREMQMVNYIPPQEVLPFEPGLRWAGRQTKRFNSFAGSNKLVRLFSLTVAIAEIKDSIDWGADFS